MYLSGNAVAHGATRTTNVTPTIDKYDFFQAGEILHKAERLQSRLSIHRPSQVRLWIIYAGLSVYGVSMSEIGAAVLCLLYKVNTEQGETTINLDSF